jgi:hypothetical protein
MWAGRQRRRRLFPGPRADREALGRRDREQRISQRRPGAFRPVTGPFQPSVAQPSPDPTADRPQARAPAAEKATRSGGYRREARDGTVNRACGAGPLPDPRALASRRSSPEPDWSSAATPPSARNDASLLKSLSGLPQLSHLHRVGRVRTIGDQWANSARCRTLNAGIRSSVARMTNSSAGTKWHRRRRSGHRRRSPDGTLATVRARHRLGRCHGPGRLSRGASARGQRRK